MDSGYSSNKAGYNQPYPPQNQPPYGPQQPYPPQEPYPPQQPYPPQNQPPYPPQNQPPYPPQNQPPYPPEHPPYNGPQGYNQYPPHGPNYNQGYNQYPPHGHGYGQGYGQYPPHGPGYEQGYGQYPPHGVGYDQGYGPQPPYGQQPGYAQPQPGMAPPGGYQKPPDSAHMHPLIEEPSNKECKVCKRPLGGATAFVCHQCTLVLCYECGNTIFYGNKQKQVHPHPLALRVRPSWTCDICRKLYRGTASFYCKPCDFDACSYCYVGF